MKILIYGYECMESFDLFQSPKSRHFCQIDLSSRKYLCKNTIISTVCLVFIDIRYNLTNSNFFQKYTVGGISDTEFYKPDSLINYRFYKFVGLLRVIETRHSN